MSTMVLYKNDTTVQHISVASVSWIGKYFESRFGLYRCFAYKVLIALKAGINSSFKSFVSFYSIQPWCIWFLEPSIKHITLHTLCWGAWSGDGSIISAPHPHTPFPHGPTITVTSFRYCKQAWPPCQCLFKLWYYNFLESWGLGKCARLQLVSYFSRTFTRVVSTSRLCNWFSLWRLELWMSLLPPVWWCNLGLCFW